MNNMQTGLDWDKNKNLQVKKRGNLSLLAVAMTKDGSVVNSGMRCIWPNNLSPYSNDKVISRRVWGKTS